MESAAPDQPMIAIRIPAGPDGTSVLTRVEISNSRAVHINWTQSPSATQNGILLQVAPDLASSGATVENEYITSLFLQVDDLSTSFGKPRGGPFFGDYLVSLVGSDNLELDELTRIHDSNIQKASRENVECVLVRSGPHNTTGTQLVSFNIDISHPDMQVGWLDSVPSQKLGFSVQVKQPSWANPSDLENERIWPLFLHLESSELFGSRTQPALLGDLIVARQDRRPLDPFQLDVLMPMLNFMVEEGRDYLARPNTGGPRLLERYLFDTGTVRQVFENIRQYDIVRGHTAVSMLENPFPHRCEHCKGTKGIDGGGLMRCGKCRITRYCGIECQKKDWPAHKLLFCKKYSFQDGH